MERDAVSDATYGLTPEQQEHFAKGRVVVATPMYGLDGTPLGVVTAFSEADDAYFGTTEHRELLRDLAAATGTLLDAMSDLPTV